MNEFWHGTRIRRKRLEQIGIAPNYLKIAGRWQDRYIFRVLNPEG